MKPMRSWVTLPKTAQLYGNPISQIILCNIDEPTEGDVYVLPVPAPWNWTRGEHFAARFRPQPIWTRLVRTRDGFEHPQLPVRIDIPPAGSMFATFGNGFYNTYRAYDNYPTPTRIHVQLSRM